MKTDGATSEVTIYHNAVQRKANENVDCDNRGDDQEQDPEITFKIKDKRDRSSSEDKIDTSDELMEININEQFILDCQRQAQKDEQSCRQQQHQHQQDQAEPDPLEKSQQVIREAEAAKARMFNTKGNYNYHPATLNFLPNSMRSVDIDENYLIIGTHVDMATQQKIINHEYVDFSKLLPKCRVSHEDDNQLEIISKGGSTYFVPVVDRENTNISSFEKWEQAFRVFSNIYTRAFPGRATELIQYNQVIYHASTLFVWENVYMYDKEFRIHMSNFPSWNWAIILQQAWSMYLKDRIHFTDNSFYNPNQQTNKQGKSKEICKRFNRGKCTRGTSCHYEHRCEVPDCGKWGHGAHICRKRKNSNGGASMSASTSHPVQESTTK